MSEEEGRYSILDSTPTDPEWLPSRFRRKNVDRFVPVIKRILEGQREIRFNHVDLGLNAGTAMARLGDAVLAITRGKQFYVDVDADKLRGMWLDYKIKYDELARQVVVLRYKEPSNIMPDNVLDAKITVGEINFVRTLTSFAWLYGTHHIIGRLTIYGMLDDQLKHQLEEDCNVRFEQLGPNEHIML